MDGGFREEVNRRTGFSDMLEVLAQLTGLDRTMLKEILASLGIPEDVLSARAGLPKQQPDFRNSWDLMRSRKMPCELMQLIRGCCRLHDTADTATGAGECCREKYAGRSGRDAAGLRSST